MGPMLIPVSKPGERVSMSKITLGALIEQLQTLYMGNVKFRKSFNADSKSAIKEYLGSDSVKYIVNKYGEGAFTKGSFINIVKGSNRLDDNALDHIAGGKEKEDRHITTTDVVEKTDYKKETVADVGLKFKGDGDFTVVIDDYGGFNK